MQRVSSSCFCLSLLVVSYSPGKDGFELLVNSTLLKINQFTTLDWYCHICAWWLGNSVCGWFSHDVTATVPLENEPVRQVRSWGSGITVAKNTREWTGTGPIFICNRKLLFFRSVERIQRLKIFLGPIDLVPSNPDFISCLPKYYHQGL